MDYAHAVLGFLNFPLTVTISLSEEESNTLH
jgi:hypothetical protein